MPPLANVLVSGDLFLCALTLLFAVVAAVQWGRLRACAYHVDTGFWALMILGFVFMSVGFGAAVLLHNLPLLPYTAKCLVLLGFLVHLTALLRLFSWSSHRHTDPA